MPNSARSKYPLLAVFVLLISIICRSFWPSLNVTDACLAVPYQGTFASSNRLPITLPGTCIQPFCWRMLIVKLIGPHYLDIIFTPLNGVICLSRFLPGGDVAEY